MVQFSDRSSLSDKLFVVLHFPLKDGLGVDATVAVLFAGGLDFACNDEVGTTTITFTLVFGDAA